MTRTGLMHELLRAACGIIRSACAMCERINLYPSEEAFVADLDRSFGYDQPPVEQIALRPYGDLYDAIARDSFEGLNNEPDMETPYAKRWSP